MQSGPKHNAVGVEAFFGWIKGVERLIGLVQCRGLVDYPSVQCEGKKQVSCSRATARVVYKSSQET
jgi:hypothetical protein